MVEIVQELEVAIEQQFGINTTDEIKHIGVKVQPEISERARTSLVKSDEVVNMCFQEPPLLMVENGLNCWWAFDQGFTSGIRLPALPCDECFTFSDKKSLCGGTHLLVSGRDIEGIVIWRYELETNKWYKGPPMIAPRSLFASATCGNSAFVAGGIAINGTYLMDNTVEKYDAETQSWSPLPGMTKPRRLCSGCYMDNKFYVIGGSNDVEGQLTCGEFFDPETNQWTLIKGMLENINHLLSYQSPPLIAVVNNQLYSIDISSNELKVYLKNTNSWKALGLVPVRVVDSKGWGAALVSFGNELVVIGASTVSKWSSSMAIYTCSPAKPQSDHLPQWKLRDYGNIKTGNFIYNCSVME